MSDESLKENMLKELLTILAPLLNMILSKENKEFIEDFCEDILDQLFYLCTEDNNEEYKKNINFLVAALRARIARKTVEFNIPVPLLINIITSIMGIVGLFNYIKNDFEIEEEL